MTDPMAVPFRDRYLEAIREFRRQHGYLVVAWPVEREVPKVGDVINDLKISIGVLEVPIKGVRVAEVIKDRTEGLAEFRRQVDMIRASVGLTVSAIGLTRGNFVKVERDQ